MEPNIPALVAAQLRRDGVDCTPHDPVYGTPLGEIVDGSWGWSWLEGAVTAGHVPHVEGVMLAVRGIHAMSMEELRRSDAAGADGDILGWCHQVEQPAALIFDRPATSVALEINESRGVAAIAALRCARDGNALAALHCAVVAAPAATDGRDGAVAG